MSREEWLKSRKAGIGSSDSACLYGCGYKTKFELWEEKTSTDIKEDVSNYAMQKGNEYEPIARNIFLSNYNIEFDTNETFDPLNVKLKEAPYIMASLDGISHDRKTIIEIKYQGLDDYQKVGDKTLPVPCGQVPHKYWIQIQHQLLASGATRCYFVSYSPKYKSSVRTAIVEPDLSWQKEHIKVCAEFWAHVETKTQPDLCDQDYKPLKGSLELEELYLKIKAEYDRISESLDTVKDQIYAKMTHPRMTYGRLFIREETRKGSIDYKKIDVIKEMSQDELDKYRSKPSKYYKIGLL